MRSSNKRAPSDPMTVMERRAVLALSGVVGLRMFGLFLIIPVFSLYAAELPGATPLMIGLGLGIYGLTQGLMQIPMGMLSDRIGRKPVMNMGLLLFIAGSVLAALADGIWGIIAGRALQGLGAIAAVGMALAADLSRPQQRGKMMALIGISIGAAFVLAMTLGPVLAGVAGLTGLFWLTAGLGVAAIISLNLSVPTPEHKQHQGPARGSFSKVLADTNLWRLDISVLCLHAILTAAFVALPWSVNEVLSGGAPTHWKVYAPTMLLSAFVLVPVVARAERQNRASLFGIIAAVLLGLSVLMFGLPGLFALVLGLFLFFVAFNVLEALMPAAVSRLAPESMRGAAMGCYTTSEFVGAFLGGVAGGLTLEHFGTQGVYVLCAGLAGIILISISRVSFGLKGPQASGRMTWPLREGAQDLDYSQIVDRLQALPGISDVRVLEDNRAVSLSFEGTAPSDAQLRAALKAPPGT